MNKLTVSENNLTSAKNVRAARQYPEVEVSPQNRVAICLYENAGLEAYDGDNASVNPGKLLTAHKKPNASSR